MCLKNSLLENFEKLPQNLQSEVLHYSEYLLSRYVQENQNQEKSNKRGGYGILKGKIWMSDDFDEPLEDLKEYM